MAKRRGRGAGSVQQRKDGRWVAVVDLGWEDGKRKRQYLYATTQKEADDLLVEAQTRKKKGHKPKDKRQTVGAYLTWWAGDEGPLKGSVKESTRADYVLVIARYITPTLDKDKLASLQGVDVQRMMANL
jgi:integrase